MCSTLFSDAKAAACVILLAMGVAVAGTAFFEAVFSDPSTEAEMIIQAGRMMVERVGR